jgi:hypothetical protein
VTVGTDPDDGRPRPIVIAGMPRSGTTWTMEVLGCDPSLLSFMEPDSEGHRASAIWAKRQAGRFPQLAPGDRNDDYRRLWSWVFSGAPEGPRLRLGDRILRVTPQDEMTRFLKGDGSVKMSLAGTLGRRPPNRHLLPDRRLLVKTVHAPLSIEWIAAEFDVDVVIVLRHPGSVLASWLDLDFVDQYVEFEVRPALRNLVRSWGVPLPGPDQLERTIWRIGMLTTALERAVAAHPTWVVRTHEQLCVDPTSEFRRLYDDLGLNWTAQAEAHLAESDRAGKGFRTQRLASELAGDWKRRLRPDQIAALQRVLAWFPLTTWTTDDFEVDPVD